MSFELRVLVLPNKTGFAVFRTAPLNVFCTVAKVRLSNSRSKDAMQVFSRPENANEFSESALATVNQRQQPSIHTTSTWERSLPRDNRC